MPQRFHINNNVNRNFLSAVQNKSSLSNKISTVAPTLYFPKIRPFQLSRRVKDYLHQVTALHSLLLRYRLSNSLFIVRPRTRSFSTRGHTSETSSHFSRRKPGMTIWLGPIILYSRASIADWLASGTISLDWLNLAAKKRGPVWRLVRWRASVRTELDP